MEAWTDAADRLHGLMRTGASLQEVEAQAAAELDRMLAAQQDDETTRVLRLMRERN